MKTILIILKLFFLAGLFIVSNNDLHLNVDADREIFIDIYRLWFNRLLNQGLELSSYVVKSEWLPVAEDNFEIVK